MEGYKVSIVAYVTRCYRQKQFAFISKAGENVRINDMSTTDQLAFDKEMHMPCFDVYFYDTFEDALQEAKTYCPNNDREGNAYLWKNDGWVRIKNLKTGELA